MLFLAVVALALVTVRPAGGHFASLAELRLRAWPLVLVALAVQVVLISILRDVPAAVAGSLHVATYAVVAVFLVANRRMRGLLVVAAGAGLNAAAIAANRGTMPASPAALRAAGIAPSAGHFANSSVVAAARLPWLGDVFAVPRQAGLLANVFSLGDVVVCLGVVLLVQNAAGCAWTQRLPRMRRVTVVLAETGQIA
jgi:hypothetical protein